MGMTLHAYVEYTHTSCLTCGVTIPIEKSHKEALVRSQVNYFCINGHSQHFIAETEESKLKKQLAAEKIKRETAEREAQYQKEQREREAKKFERHKKRVANGVCPCCNRTFVNLMRHMKTKHPDHVKS